MPTFNLLYFKNLLDIAFLQFFDKYNDLFQKIDDCYVFSADWDAQKLAGVLKKTIVDVLRKHVVKYDRLKPTYYLIIGACMPKDNMLLKYKDMQYFPQKLDKLVNSSTQLKYVLKEQDIKIDRVLMNNACIMLFNEFFGKKEVKLKKDVYKNIIFVQHKHLDCYSVFKLVKHAFGRSNCVNMHEALFKDCKSPIVAVNDLIDKYVNKTCMNISGEFKLAGKELVQYINERISSL